MSHVFPRCLLAKGCPNRLQQPIHLQLNVSQDCLRLINVKIRLVTQGREETKTDMVTSKNASIAGGTKTAWRRILGIFCLNDETCSWVVMCWKQDKNFAAVFFFFVCLFGVFLFLFFFFLFVFFFFFFFDLQMKDEWVPKTRLKTENWPGTRGSTILALPIALFTPTHGCTDSACLWKWKL